MKKLFITLAALAITFSTFAQGTVNFATRVIGVKVFLANPDGSASTVGPGLSAKSVSAQLALVGAGGSLTLLAPIATFQTGATTQWYVSGGSVAIPGFGAGTTATLRMLAFETSFGSYDAAKSGGGLFGASNDFVTGALGGTPPAPALPITAPNLVGLQSFVVGSSVPEPTTLALLGLGGLALAIRRRK